MHIDTRELKQTARDANYATRYIIKIRGYIRENSKGYEGTIVTNALTTGCTDR